ncbi:MAG TPA: DegV family protein [Anaerolineae bacterium]
MSAIALVTDSTANMPDELVRHYGVTVVPLYVRFGDTVQKDYVELPPAEFYKRLAKVKAAGGELPKTSQPTPGDFEATYRAIASGGAKDILSLHVAAKMSGTLNSAQVAGDAVSQETHVHVADSTTISMQMGYMLIQAAEMIRRGGGVQAALDAIEKVKANSCTYFTVTEVEHIEASGRVEGADKMAEAEIKVRPVIGIFDGQAKVVSPERTQRAAIDKVIELTCNRLRGLKLKGVTVIHTNAPDRAEALKARVSAELGYKGEVFVVELGPVLAVHVGPGVVGLAAFGE